MCCPIVVAEVVPELLLPQEIVHTLTFVFDKVTHNISVVDFNRNQGHNNFTEDVWNLLSHNQCQFS